jgi:hypothetical protein
VPYARCSIFFLPIRESESGDTSANLSEEPIAIDNDEAQRAWEYRDALMHDREIFSVATTL